MNNEEEELISSKKEKGGEGGIELASQENESKTLEEELTKNAPKVERIIGNVEKQEEGHKEDLIINGADKSNVKEFDEGKEVINRGLEAAKYEYGRQVNEIKGDIAKKIIKNTMKSQEALSPELRQEEIKKELEKINNKIDRGYEEKMSLEETNALKEQRARLFDLLEEFNPKDVEPETGRDKKKTENIETGDVADKKPEGDFRGEEEKEIIAANEWSEKTQEEIKRLLGDPSSELSILLKAVNFREDYISKLEADLEKAELNKIDRESRVKFYKDSIAEHKAILEKHRKRMKEITNEIERRQ